MLSYYTMSFTQPHGQSPITNEGAEVRCELRPSSITAFSCSPGPGPRHHWNWSARRPDKLTHPCCETVWVAAVFPFLPFLLRGLCARGWRPIDNQPHHDSIKKHSRGAARRPRRPVSLYSRMSTLFVYLQGTKRYSVFLKYLQIPPPHTMADDKRSPVSEHGAQRRGGGKNR